METKAPRVRIEPWSEGDLDLLRAANAPELMTHLGGPETEEQLAGRHRRYVDLSADRTGRGRMFRVVLLPGGEAVGTIGFWEQTWQGEQVYETGWAVLAAFQGRGIAAAATAAVVERARAEKKHRYLHAFPSIGNPPSNAVCRKAGFTLRGECEFEYPVGHLMRCNDWRLDLTAMEQTP
ncbi:GNAT family N-acetyltransferase [Streptomyces sp. AK02-01A]|uniref:GNAT family N-acetyltransferase n=1 Tax=Streptomyces sp. AK02-01A TaxID=3028648 RepID=UPI0029B8E0F9|nr:GNAT family N-acetyltransferase [Streptomyces sp. AK02-01A]MDX3851097.1 GNAT family N-acetyltransferase [Streptomyces sp. AK02-01A]